MPFFSAKISDLRLKKKINFSLGFTLIELLVVIAIIGILSTIVLASYNNYIARQQVRNAAFELKSELRKFQTFAKAGQKNPDPAVANCANFAVGDPDLQYYEIYLEPSGVDPTTDPGNYQPTLFCGTDVDPTFKSVPLQKVIYSDDFEVNLYDEIGGDCADLTIRFLTLNAAPILLCGASPTQQAKVTVEIKASGVTYKVHTTRGGIIYEER